MCDGEGGGKAADMAEAIARNTHDHVQLLCTSDLRSRAVHNPMVGPPHVGDGPRHQKTKGCVQAWLVIHELDGGPDVYEDACACVEAHPEGVVDVRVACVAKDG